MHVRVALTKRWSTPITGIVMILIVASVSACGADSDRAASSTGLESSPVSSPRDDSDPAAAANARSVLRGALCRWTAADTGSFDQTLSIEGQTVQMTTGVYELSFRTSSMTLRTDDTDGVSQEFRFLGVPGVTFLRVTNWPDAIRRCWLRLDAQTMESVTGLPAVAGGGGLPANVVALSNARGVRIDPDRPDIVIGSVDLAIAGPMFGSGVARLFRDPSLDASVPAELTVNNRDIAGWAVSGDDLATAMDREGLFHGMSDDLRDQARDALARMRVSVLYPKLGSVDVGVREPARSLQMTAAQMDSKDGCTAAR